MSSDEESEVPSSILVQYCKACSMPYEYCDHGPCPERCAETKPAGVDDEDGAVAAVTEGVDGLVVDDGAAEGEEAAAAGGGGKKSKRGGRATKASREAQKAAAGGGPAASGVTITITQRNKRKFVTNVVGLGTYGINLKKAAKAFAGRFACGAAVNGADEIGITGDHTNDIADVIVDKFPEVPAKDIIFKGKK